LGDLAAEKFKRIGQRVRPLGESLGHGLTLAAAKDLGLSPGTPVSVSIIDAHAGGLGLLGAPVGGRKVTPAALKTRLALIGGTSSCHMAVSEKPLFIPGIWGPYFSAMIPDLWLTEGGQSATGALIDHIIFSHAASVPLLREAKARGVSIYQLLNSRLDALAKSEKSAHPGALTHDLPVQPDFHGNRSPRANPNLRGTITGLPLSSTADDLARQYLATIQAVAYGTRHILEEMNKHGYAIRTLLACGEHADITGCAIVLPKEPEAVLLGSAVLGAVAARRFPSVLAAMNAMNATDKVIEPTGRSVNAYHDRKYKIFLRLHDDFLAYRRIMGPRPFSP
jgi:FGGY-family pentulose kinase